jgi:YidC/Oxa1 family membrane protein insertase
MSSNQQPSMFDGRLILAIGLTVLMWIGYQSYLQKKYPDAYKAKNSVEKTVAKTPGTEIEKEAMLAEGTPNTPSPEALPNAAAQSAESFLDVADSQWNLRISSKGMGLSQITLNQYTDREGKEIHFDSVTGTRNFETNLVGRKNPIDFQLSRPEEHQILGIAKVGGMTIRKILNLEPETYSMDIKIVVENADPNFSGIVTKIGSTIIPSKGGSMFNPTVEYQEFFVASDEGEERVALKDGVDKRESFNKVSISAIASQYFALALVDDSNVIPEFQATSEVQKESPNAFTQAIGTLVHPALSKSGNFAVTMKAYAGPKSWKALEAVDKNLTSMINFGFFKKIAGWIFKLLLSIHAAVGNWGWAIILLTILVRVLVLPFNILSYRSMKAMSKVQPEIKTIREKYKNDPAKANQEIMRIMKESKANPLGGCLPIFLQIPVFFALYQVLGQSIELYKAPFFLWINDLSQHDRFFVFPALMGITMFIQQRITPSTLEPAQQKILLFMPIFLTVLMAGLPSGLTLYMFVSTLFGVSQQIYFTKDDKKRAASA